MVLVALNGSGMGYGNNLSAKQKKKRSEVSDVMGDSVPSDDYSRIDQSLENELYSQNACDEASHRCLLKDSLVQRPVLGLTGLLTSNLSLSLSLFSSPLLPPLSLYFLYLYLCVLGTDIVYEMYRG